MGSFAGAPAAAQWDPEDVVAFFSLESYAGEPTLVVEIGHEQSALEKLDAVPVDGTHYLSPHLGMNLPFEVNPVALLPLGSEPPDPDTTVLVYRNRACAPGHPESVNTPCVLVTDPNDPNFGYWKLGWDPGKNRCTAVVAGEYCLEFLTVGWHYQFFYDEGCTVEVPGTHEEYPAHYCVL